VTRVCAVAVVLIGGLTLTEYILGRNFGFDQLLVHDIASTIYPGRMSPITAANFVLVGLALLFLGRMTRGGQQASKWFAFTASFSLDFSRVIQVAV